MTTTTVRSYKAQKAALTKLTNKLTLESRRLVSGWTDEATCKRVRDLCVRIHQECQRTVGEWESPQWAAEHRVRVGAWPDDWARWNRALGDAGTAWRRAGGVVEHFPTDLREAGWY